MGIKVVLTGFIAVLISAFILAPILFRSIESIDDQKISVILERVAKQLNYKAIPKMYKIRTAQLNAIAYFMINKPSIGLTTGILEAYQNNYLNDQDFECIFAYLLSYHISQNCFKRYFMYGISSLYNSIGYILIFLGRGFLRIADMTEAKGSKFFAWLSGHLCLLVGTIFRIPTKIGSIFAFLLINRFQRNADLVAKNITSPTAMQEVLQKMHEYNKKIDKKLSILPEPEYWFIQPVQLFKIDKMFLFSYPLEKRIRNFSILS
jgi:Zn-dependent protease with chaperone function